MKAIDDNHNKDGYFAYPNEREVTEERTYEGNINELNLKVLRFLMRE